MVWSRYFDPNLSTELGYRLSTRPGTRDRGFAGVRYRWPYLVMTALTVDTEGDLREAALDLVNDPAFFTRKN